MNPRRERSRVSTGAWSVQRERCSIPDYGPPPEFREASPIGSLIPALMKKLGLESQQWLSALEEEWTDLVGGAVAKHTRPGRFRNGALVVFVDSSTWLSELSRYGRDKMLKNLQARFGVERITGVRLEPDPGRDASG